MAIATGQMQTLSLKEESTYGTSAGGNFLTVEHNSNSLALTINQLEEATLRGTREVNELIAGTHAVAGDIQANLSQQATHITLIQAALCDHTAANTNQFSIAGERKTYTFAREFTDMGSTDDNQLFLGCEINTLGISVPADGFVGVTYGIIGSTMTSHDSSEDGDATAVTAKVPYRGSDATIIVENAGGSSSTGQTIITNFELNIENGLENSYVVGNNKSTQGALGKARVTGSFTAHLTSGDFVARFLSATDTRIKLLLGSGATGMSFEMPRCRFTNTATEAGGEGMIECAVEFTALQSTDAATSCITFDSAL